jgi:pimeloyl-ACP methyl ester carboxylesterase
MRCETQSDMLDHVRRRKIALPDSGIEIALLDWGGDGPLALLHHANGFCAGVWGLVAELLKDRYRVIAMDARGHGDSSKPEGANAYNWNHFSRDVLAVAEILAAESADGQIALGLGHSFGGCSILMASAQRPDLFACNVLIDPVVLPADWDHAAFAASSNGNVLADGARSRRQIWPNREAARSKWQGKELFADWDPKALDLYVAEGLADRPDGQVELKCSGETEAAIFEGTGSSDLWPAAHRVQTPTLIERASRGVFPLETYEELAARMKSTTILEIEAGHLAPMQHPDRVVAPILDFTSRLP